MRQLYRKDDQTQSREPITYFIRAMRCTNELFDLAFTTLPKRLYLCCIYPYLSFVLENATVFISHLLVSRPLDSTELNSIVCLVAVNTCTALTCCRQNLFTSRKPKENQQRFEHIQ